jgi:hypothetical protein
MLDGTTKVYPAEKVLQAKLTTDTWLNAQNIAYIDEWDYNTPTFSQLRQMKITLNWFSTYAKALLNYKSHKEIGQPNVLKATVAIVAVTRTGDTAPLKGTVSGTTYQCPLELENNTFDVRFLRPLSIDDKNNPDVTDAHTSGTVEIQEIPLSDLVQKFIDWRDDWQPYDDGTGLNYMQYYAPENSAILTATVNGIGANQMLSDNANVKTDLNGTVQPLNQVHTDLQLQMNATGTAILYRNNSSTVRDFHIYIPVVVEYYWGTLYDDVTVTVHRTVENARKQ